MVIHTFLKCKQQCIVCVWLLHIIYHMLENKKKSVIAYVYVAVTIERLKVQCLKERRPKHGAYILTGSLWVPMWEVEIVYDMWCDHILIFHVNLVSLLITTCLTFRPSIWHQTICNFVIFETELLQYCMAIIYVNSNNLNFETFSIDIIGFKLSFLL